jgi:hypothetical protein
LPDFSWYNIPKRENIHKWPQTMPKGHEIYEMPIKFNNIFHCKTLPSGSPAHIFSNYFTLKTFGSTFPNWSPHERRQWDATNMTFYFMPVALAPPLRRNQCWTNLGFCRMLA